MTTKDKVARRKLSLLELAKELENVSRACKVMGYSRQQFYEIRRNFEQVVGSSIVTEYEEQDGKPVLVREPKIFFIDDKGGKPIGINLCIGKRPYRCRA